ncbi:M20/M25/M40 family metallo-hydrolase [Aminipila butyrica]|uniref:M20/M25/M40 family metallo-hydrolase n=1 Tax=Aminipila butyrica TaxID=433296 RepID=A0A858BX65_9FIRM|nr:M20/M25/M40 family metallo-hydrolase [Aminipila butyrica]QIB70543.1 M20/M25/M40 family metallo-hydrolase [Aminipila butyrica]
MDEKKERLEEIGQDIRKILLSYIKAESFTFSSGEKAAEDFLMKHFSDIPYFKQHPEYFGTYAIPEDPFERAVSYGLVKGEGPDTVVFIHHNDVVEIGDYKLLKPYAFSPEPLKEELLKIKDSLPEEAQLDLLSGDYLFGRGVCDMKGGGAIQLALLERYSRVRGLKGNILLLAVPDEENLSAGMRAAVSLLKELKQQYGLNYRMMINSEPHQRKEADKGIFSEGSVGKLMPFIYARGYLSHIGKVFEGLNPLNVMSEILRRTELNLAFSDVEGREMAPPPTWLYLKDNKKQYDVSMPLSVSGCFSILTLNRTPQGVMEQVEEICRQSFETVLAEMQKRYQQFAQVKQLPEEKLPWTVQVTDFTKLYEEACDNYGEAFTGPYGEKLQEIKKRFNQGLCSIIECNFELVEFIYQYIDDISPRIVYGLVPPYYPNVSNRYYTGLAPDIADLSGQLCHYTEAHFGQTYEVEDFYTGISDLSYTSIREGKETVRALNTYMPLFGSFYAIPIEELEEVSMPCINIGPWGKDFHKLTERVYEEDLYHRTPDIIDEAVSLLLNW